MEFIIVTAIVLGLTQVFKMFGFTDRWTALFSLAAGIAVFTIATAGANVSVGEQLLQGLIAGLTACGFWSGTKAVIENKSQGS
jgi:hypothetical protein